MKADSHYKGTEQLVMQIDRARALLNIFIEQTRSALKILEEAVDNNNYEEIRMNAHFIKGSAGNLRIDGIQGIAKEIELGAMEKQDIDVIKGNIEKLITVFEEVKKEVSSG
jgi:HPt (histidine-containing phosphotransfer) domain-containing protein